MQLTKCVNCLNYFEDDDIQKVENKYFCHSCVKECKHCDKPFDYPGGDYCYDCLEQDLVK